MVDIHRQSFRVVCFFMLCDLVLVSVLQLLCSNPDGGYWCGDTAQTINVGSSFRIKDLKAFIYENMVCFVISRLYTMSLRSDSTAPKANKSGT